MNIFRPEEDKHIKTKLTTYNLYKLKNTYTDKEFTEVINLDMYLHRLGSYRHKVHMIENNNELFEKMQLFNFIFERIGDIYFNRKNMMFLITSLLYNLKLKNGDMILVDRVYDDNVFELIIISNVGDGIIRKLYNVELSNER